MSTDEVAGKAVACDLASVRFRLGTRRGYWRTVSYQFPLLLVSVAAVEPDGTTSEYYFRFELTGFPAATPEVKIWDLATGAPLAPNKRPKGSPRVTEAFKDWANGSVYRPWERHGGPHNNWATTHPELAWHAKREITFILEDLHGLLTSNAAAHGNRPAS